MITPHKYLFSVFIVLIVLSCVKTDPVNNSKITFIRPVSGQYCDKIIEFMGNSESEIEALCWANIEHVLWLNNNRIIYPIESSDMAASIHSAMYVAFDLSRHISDSLAVEGVDDEKCLGIFTADSAYVASYSDHKLMLFTLDSLKFEKYYEIELNQCFRIIWLRISPSGRNIICLGDTWKAPSPPTQKVFIIDTKHSTIDTLDYDCSSWPDPVVFESDTSFFIRCCDYGIQRCHVNGDMETIDAEGPPLVGYFDNRYLVALDIDASGKKGSVFMHYDAFDHFKKSIIDKGIITGRINYNMERQALLYSKFINKEVRDCELRSYSFKTKKIVTILKSNRPIYNPHYIY